MKTCAKCNIEKPETEFKPLYKKPDKLMSKCKECYKIQGLEYRIRTKAEKAAYDKEYRANNEDKLKKRSLKYYQDNKEHLLEYAEEYRQRNPELLKESKKKEYFKHKKKRIAQVSKYRKNHKDKVKIWSDRWVKSDKGRVSSRKAHTKRRGYGDISKDVIVDFFKTAGTICLYCKVECNDKVTIDHFIPLSKGGSHERDNLVPACLKCNCSKSNKDPFEWAESKGYILNLQSQILPLESSL
jgi:5-methylcytosine-specific restriction endonuclease McrA